MCYLLLLISPISTFHNRLKGKASQEGIHLYKKPKACEAARLINGRLFFWRNKMKLKSIWTIPVSFAEVVAMFLVSYFKKYFECAYSAVKAQSGTDQIEKGISAVAGAQLTYQVVLTVFSIVMFLLICAVVFNTVTFIKNNFFKGASK